MILIADSGSTKTDWLLRTEDGGYSYSTAIFHTQGINPIHQDDKQITAILRDELLPQLTARPCAIQFYGSGVRPDQEERMERLLREAFTNGQTQEAAPTLPPLSVTAKSDLLGAARALCSNSEGLACILGTGANSCLYDGQCIVANTPPMGYILGDEGSGAVLGIRFLNALYKGHLNRQTLSDFEAIMQTNIAAVIDHVYRQPMANRWLASLSPFIHDHLGDPGVEALVVGNFSDFIARNIEPYQRRDLPLQAVGSIAYFYKPQLCEAAQKAGYEVGLIIRSPLQAFLSQEDLETKMKTKFLLSR